MGSRTLSLLLLLCATFFALVSAQHEGHTNEPIPHSVTEDRIVKLAEVFLTPFWVCVVTHLFVRFSLIFFFFF